MYGKANVIMIIISAPLVRKSHSSLYVAISSETYHTRFRYSEHLLNLLDVGAGLTGNTDW